MSTKNLTLADKLIEDGAVTVQDLLDKLNEVEDKQMPVGLKTFNLDVIPLKGCKFGEGRLVDQTVGFVIDTELRKMVSLNPLKNL